MLFFIFHSLIYIATPTPKEKFDNIPISNTVKIQLNNLVIKKPREESNAYIPYLKNKVLEKIK